MAVPALYIIRSREKPVELLAAGKSNLKTGLSAGLITGIMFFLLIYLFFHFFGASFMSRENVNSFLGSIGYKKTMLIPLVLYFIFFNSVVEELFWRGFIYSYFRKNFGPILSGLWASFFFIQYHFLTIWLIFSPVAAFVFTPVLFGASVFWCSLRERLESVYAPIAGHLLADLAIIAVYYRFVQP
jgi:membrane protease YdiL (CAAX protease family)